MEFELVRDATVPAAGFVGAWLEGSTPVLVQHARFRAAALLPDGRSTSDVPHVRVSMEQRRGVYVGLVVEAVGQRRVRTMLRADVTALTETTDAAPWLAYARDVIRAACERARGVDDEAGEPTRTVIGATTGLEYTIAWHEDPSDSFRGFRYTWRDASGREFSAGGGGMVTRWDTAEEAAAAVQVWDRIVAATAGYAPLERDAYEAECARFGVEPKSEDNCDSYAARYGDFDLATYGLDGVVGWRLAQRRERAIRADRELAAVAAPATDRAARPWGTGGVRYDEACERCGRVSEVDNTSGVCQRCAGAR